MYGLTDTHCHITDERLFSRIDEIMENAKVAGVVRMLVVCVGFEEYERAEQLREKGYPLDIAWVSTLVIYINSTKRIINI